MNITTGKMADGNPGGGIAGLLQMIQTMSAGASSQPGVNLMNLNAEGTDANPFSQILLQQITVLLQTGGLELSDAPTKEELAAAIQNLLDTDQAQTDAGMSGLTMLALAGQQLLGISGNEMAGDLSETSIKQGEAGAVASSGKAKEFLPGGQLTSVIVQAIRDYLKDAGSKDNEPLSMQAEGAGVAAKTLQEDISKDLSEAENAGDKFAGEIKSLLKNENGDVKRSDMTALKEAAPLKADSSVNINQANAGEKTVTIPDTDRQISSDQINTKMKEMATPVSSGKPAEENTFVESRIGQAGVHIKTITPDGKVKGTVSEENSEQGDSLKISGIAENGGQDVKKKVLAEEEVTHQNSRMDADALREQKTNAPGKDMRQSTVATTESQVTGEKFKTELKGKTAVIDRSAENSQLSSATLSSGVSNASTKEDISSTSIINRVAAEFRENMMNEGGRIKITLAPPSLGQLEMDVSVMNNKVKVMLIAENKDVQKILSGNLETLKTTLQTQGLTIERCDVMMQDNRDEYPRGFTGQQAFGQEQAGGERNSRQETLDEKPLRRPAALHVQEPVRRHHYSGSESISLFA